MAQPDFMGLAGSLQGTMTNAPDDMLAAGLAELQRQAMAQFQSQQGNANQQFGALQAAQQAPSNEAPPLGALLPMIGAGINSAASGNPVYEQRSNEALVSKRADIMKRRLENLELLSGRYKEAAEAAKQSGQIVEELKFRTQYDKLLKQHDVIQKEAAEQRNFGRTTQQDKTKHGYEMEEQQLIQDRTDYRARLAETKANATLQKQLDKERRGYINTLSDNINKDHDVVEFMTVRDAYSIGQRAFNYKNNLGDILLMRMVAKTSDAKSSVREEEFKTFERAQGTLAKAGVYITKGMWGKGTLNDYGREFMLKSLNDIYSTKELQHKRAVDLYSRQADAYGVPRELVLRDYTIPGISDSTSLSQPPQAGQPQSGSWFQQNAPRK